MSWDRIVGHEKILNRFTQSYRQQRMANTYLFVGREGIGKRQFALSLAKSLFCKESGDRLESCGKCSACLQVDSSTHPDLIQISKPRDKNFLPVELFVGDREHRRQTGLCHDIHLTPFSSDRKFAIIDDADFFNAESANSLLKLLEEPPNNSILVLIGTSEHRQLPTILSRCQVIRFGALTNDQVADLLRKQSLQTDLEIESLASIAGGSVSRAIELNDQELFSFREELLSRLATLDPADHFFAKTICAHVDSVSKESAVKRRRLSLIGEFAIEFFAEVLRASLQSNDSENFPIAAKVAADYHADDLSERMPEMIERTIQFQQHVDANMAAANIVPAWLNDLGAIARRDRHVYLN